MRQANSQQDLFIDAPVWDTGLTGRQRRFVEYYCTDKTCFLNAAASYIKAYSRPGKEISGDDARPNAARMMRNPAVKEAAARLLRAAQNEEDKLSEFRILKLLATLATYNPADIIEKDGRLKVKENLSELGDLAACITGIETDARGNRRIKLFDRTKAIELLSRYLDIIRPADGQVILSAGIYLGEKEKEALRAEAGAAPEAAGAEYQILPPEE